MKFRLSALWRSVWAAVLLLLASLGSALAQKVDVILWFDTEDYLLPADDDACKRLADLLAERHIQATFKVVGEKARVLQQRGRQDVIDALNKHDIGYHANFHSVHPTPSEYLADCALLDGMAEFSRREGGGAEDVRRIFGRATLACYGQPGSSWAAQAVAALPQIGVAPHGISCYVDEGDHVGLDQQPFWFAGALNVYHMGQNYTRMELHDPAAVQPAKDRVSAIASRLKANGGGLISIFYHPCEWVHQEFWDGVNFRRGANPPREQWKAPPQRPAAETEAAFQRFAEYIDYIRSLPDIAFVTASDLPVLYPDTLRTEGASEDELVHLAQGLVSDKGIDMVRSGKKAFSLADQFELLTRASAAFLESSKVPYPLVANGLLGPDGPPPAQAASRQLAWTEWRAAVLDCLDYLQVERRVPARVFIGADPVAPADFLGSLADGFLRCRGANGLPKSGTVTLSHGREVLPARHVASDTPGLFGGWIIHKEGFRAPQIMEVARWQAWTLKPAILAHD
jgi:hypothetical protein